MFCIVCFENPKGSECSEMCFKCENEVERVLYQEQIEIRAIESEMRDLIS